MGILGSADCFKSVSGCTLEEEGPLEDVTGLLDCFLEEGCALEGATAEGCSVLL